MKTQIRLFLILFFVSSILELSLSAADFSQAKKEHRSVEFEGSIPKEFQEACIKRDKALENKSQKMCDIKNLEHVKNLLREEDLNLARLKNALGDELFSFIITFNPNIKLIVDASYNDSLGHLENMAVAQIRNLLL
jgi:hypothetical protein